MRKSEKVREKNIKIETKLDRCRARYIDRERKGEKNRRKALGTEGRKRKGEREREKET